MAWAKLETDHIDESVVIEPKSGDNFLGNTLYDATRSAHKIDSDRLLHAMRAGHGAALQFGLDVRQQGVLSFLEINLRGVWLHWRLVRVADVE
jgi:hypothetical protein